MKFSVSSYSFARRLNEGKYTQLTLIEKVKAMGFDGIEFTDLQPENGLSDSEYAALLAEQADKCGIAIVNYTIGADFLNAAGGWEAEAERLFGQVDVAVCGTTPPPAFRALRRNTKALTPLCRSWRTAAAW